MPLRIPRYFILRRLYSLSGIFPLALFLPLHLYLNALSLSPKGVATYNNAVQAIYGIPFLLFFEILLIYIPLVLHVLMGLFILSRTATPVTHYPSWNGFRYLLQRVSGVVALSFILYHFFTIRWPILLTHQPIIFDTMRLRLSSTVEIIFYLLGTWAVIFYVCHGIWSFFITWGLTVGTYSQKLSFRFCMALMILLTSISWITIFKFAGYGEGA